MRRVNIVVTCDVCEEPIEEEVEGSASVSFTVRGEQWEMDLCDECIGGTFLQEARPVINRRKRKQSGLKEFVCGCGKSFDTQRGLSRHETAAHG